MKKKCSKLIIVSMVLLIVLSMTTVAFGMGDDVKTALQGGSGVMGDGAMDTIMGISTDIFNIIRYVVIAYLVIKLFSFFSQFSNAGDQPQLKAQLKSKLLWTAGGLVLALNFWSIYNFIADISIDLIG